MPSEFRCRTLTNKGHVQRLLEYDRLYAAYAIGNLADPVFAECQWSVAEDDSAPRALGMMHSGLAVPALFLMGDSEGVAALLETQIAPLQAHIVLRPEHMAAASAFYQVSDERQMWRMAVSQGTFRPAPAGAVRLRPADIAAANDLYAWGGPDFLSVTQLAHGVYYAAAHGSRLLAAAGTHFVAPEYGIAAVGNVYTALEHRNRGYATACTSAVVAELLAMGCRDVVLNVRQDNEPAIRSYSNLGFHIYCPFIETPGRRRSRLQRILQRVPPPSDDIG